MVELGKYSRIVWRIIGLCVFAILCGFIFTIFGMGRWGGGFFYYFIYTLFFIGFPIMVILIVSLIVLVTLKK